MSRVYWDAMLFIYLLEGNPAFAPRVKAILQQMQRRNDTLCTSVFTLGEVLTGPRKTGFLTRVERTRHFFLDSGRVELVPFGASTADRYSVIRAATSAKSADAIHLACAAEHGVELFLTHDKSLRKFAIPGIHFIAGIDTDLY
ncbi:MAG TPA: PIN domain-containing protein [Terracidiphilus sp.]|jgi:predicted nucleic acid-binding protein|nr:PIN domain-containing protein [Terracidiphilus sp.]